MSVIKDNLLIAEYLGWHRQEGQAGTWFIIIDNIRYVKDHDPLNFHQDWSKLMPVLKKLNQDYTSPASGRLWNKEIKEALFNVDINTTYSLVLKEIKYINKLANLSVIKREGVKAMFTIQNRSHAGTLGSFIYIIDHANKYQSMSVTNDAEAVVEFLAKNSSLTVFEHLFCKDTDERVDELLFNESGEFTGFQPGYASEQEFIEAWY